MYMYMYMYIYMYINMYIYIYVCIFINIYAISNCIPAIYHHACTIITQLVNLTKIG